MATISRFAVVVLALFLGAAPSLAQSPTDLPCDVCVVGGGSGGMGTALAAARAGAQVVLIEKQAKLGGTSCRAYVSNWEPGPGSTLAREIYRRLDERGAAGVTRDFNRDRKLGPFGLWLVDPKFGYDDTLQRAGFKNKSQARMHWHAAVFDPDVMHEVVMEMLHATGNCRVLLNTTYTRPEIEKPGSRLAAVQARANDGSRTYRIAAEVFVDCTGDVYLCRDAGCEVMRGPEPEERFGESFAPEKVRDPYQVNATSLCYRIRKKANPKRQPPEPGSPRHTRSAHVSAIPGTDDLIINPLGLVPGRVFVTEGYGKVREVAEPAARAHWRWLQEKEFFSDYELVELAPMLGIRESYRVVGEYVLRQQDLMQGADGQKHDDLIALADHALDTHGKGGRCMELPGAYGIPYRCLIPKGWENLMVACRGSSFSHVAASSCRLNRTMLALGQAAGIAAAQAARRDVPIDQVDIDAVQKELAFCHRD